MPGVKTVIKPVRHVLYLAEFAEERAAFAYAVSTAERWAAKLTLLHVIPEPEAQFWKAYIYEVDDVDDKAKADIDAKIRTYADCVPAGIEFSVVHKIGRPDEEVVFFAVSADVDLIMLSRPASSALREVFFANMPERIIRHARCPVLIIP
ncbi:MAG: universal stress protein [Lentisphaeria bacterium]|nr:universal stress protein [Lentisphaeria bacterium]